MAFEKIGARFTLDNLDEDVEFRLRITGYTSGASDRSMVTLGDAVAIADGAAGTIPIEYFFAARDGEDYDALLLSNGPADAGATLGAEWDSNISGQPADIGPNLSRDPNFLLQNALGNLNGPYWEIIDGSTISYNATGGEDGGPVIEFAAGGNGSQTLIAPYLIPAKIGDTFFAEIYMYVDPTFDGSNFNVEIEGLDESQQSVGSSPAVIDWTNVSEEGTGWVTVKGAASVVDTSVRYVRLRITKTPNSTGVIRVSHVEWLRAQPGATLGARLGQDVYNEAGDVLSDIDVRNDLAVTTALGAVNPNPGFEQFRQGPLASPAPAQWWSYGASTQISYLDENTRDIVILPINGDMYLVNSAFRANTNIRYEIIVMARAQVGATADLRVDMVELDSDLATGQRAIRGNPYTGAGSDSADLFAAGDRSVSVINTNNLTTSFAVYTGEYQTTSSALWVSPEVYIGTDSGGGYVELEWFVIREMSTEGAKSNDNIVSEIFVSEDFGDGDIDRIHRLFSEIQSDYDPSSSQIVAASGIIGSFAWQYGDNLGNDQMMRAVARHRALPIVTNQIYKITVMARRVAGVAGGFFAGLVGWKGDVRTGNGSKVNIAGLDTFSDSHYFAASNVSIGTSWATFEGYFTRDDLAYSDSTTGTVNDPYILHPDVEYVTPVVLVHWEFNQAISQIGYVEVTPVAGAIMEWGDVADDGTKPADNATANISALNYEFFSVNTDTTLTEGNSANYTIVDHWQSDAGGVNITIVGEEEFNFDVAGRYLIQCVMDVQKETGTVSNVIYFIIEEKPAGSVFSTVYGPIRGSIADIEGGSTEDGTSVAFNYIVDVEVNDRIRISGRSRAGSSANEGIVQADSSTMLITRLDID